MKIKLLLSLSTICLSSVFANAQANRVAPAPPPAAVPTVPITCTIANGDRVRGSAGPVTPQSITVLTEYAGAVTLRPTAITSCEAGEAALQARVNEVIEAAVVMIAAAEAGNEMTPAAAAAAVAATRPPSPAAPANGNTVAANKTAAPAATTSTAGGSKPDEGKGAWKKTIAFSYNFARGNTDIDDMNISGGAEYKDTDGRFLVQSLMRRGTKNGKDIAGLFTSTARYERNIDLPSLARKKASLFNEINFERDAMKKLDHRVVWNGGMQLPLFKKEANELALDLGGGMTREVYESDAQRTLGSGLIRLKSEQKILGNTKLTQQFAAFPDFAEVGRYRLHADISVTAPLTKIFSIRIGALNRFDNRPQEAVKRNDFSLQSGLAVNF